MNAQRTRWSKLSVFSCLKQVIIGIIGFISYFGTQRNYVRSLYENMINNFEACGGFKDRVFLRDVM